MDIPGEDIYLSNVTLYVSDTEIDNYNDTLN